MRQKDRQAWAILRSTTVALALTALLSICSGPGISAEKAPVSAYTVRWGDTLARIAYRFYGDGKLYPLIAEANRITDPHCIISGTILTIPPKQDASPTAVIPAAAEVSASNGTKKLLPGATEQPAAPLPDDSLTGFFWRQEPGGIFEAGEKLSFDVKWQFITVGYATMEIHDIEDISGRQAYHIVTAARSAAFFDNFYKVRDTNESWMDVESLCSLKYASHISENSTKRDETTLLDHQKKQYQNVESGKTGDIPQWVQDVLSSLYYLRTKNLAVGQEFSFDTHTGDTAWPLKVKVLRMETVNVPAGRFICYVVEPSIREGSGIFEAKGKLQVWLTADEKKVPVMMRSKIAVGSVDAELTKMQLK